MFSTMFLMTIMTLLMVFIGNYFGGEQGMLIMLVISCVSNFIMYWNSDKMALAQYQATQVDANTAPELYGIVQKLAERGGLPMPRVYIVNSAVPNAFATGRNPEHAAVCVTSGIMKILSPEELSGVLGHELSHVKHNDILLSSVVASMAGVISMMSRFGMYAGTGRRDNENRSPIAGLLMLILAPLAAMLIQLAISRSREYMADYSGGILCGNPDYLASALDKIDAIATQRTLPNASPSTAHMFIVSPFSAQDAKALFSTHPATEDRIKKLQEESEEMRAGKKLEYK